MTSVRPAVDVVPKPDATRHASTYVRRVAGVLTGHSAARGYSRDRLLDFDDYARSAPRWRLALVVLGTPLLPLAGVLLPPLLPLADPARGILANAGFCVHFVVVMAYTVLGGLLQGRAATSLPHHEYTTRQAVAVSVLSSSHLLGVTIALAQLWRFPIPFTWALDFVPWVLCVVWAKILVFRGQLFSGALKRPVIAFLPSFVVQISQIILYPAFSAGFGFVNEYQQVLLTLLFPAIKFFMKKVLRIASRPLGEYSEEVAVGGVEICAAMYQSQIMQNTPSYIATAAIMGVDLLQGMLSVKVFMDKSNHVVARRDIVPTAIRFLRSKQPVSSGTSPLAARADQTSIQEISAAQSKRSTGEGTGKLFVPSHGEGVKCALSQVAPLTASENTREAKDDGDNETTVNLALEIMHSAESILLVEYFEVSIPVVNGIFVALASQMDSARYNPNLRAFNKHPERLRGAMTSLLLYSVLQGLSLVSMNLVMWYRYRISATAYLSYVLERHRWSVQGKMVSWLAVFFNFTVMHYGTDFTFKFNFSVPEDN